jgi:hypothetical protein
MITDAYLQHELLKTAMEATDNYLAIKKKAMDAKMATNAMIHDFSYHMTIAHDALQSLGVLDQHEDYMKNHVDDMLKLHGHKDATIGDLPYAHVPKADFGEVEESVQDKMYARHQALRKASGLPHPDYYKELKTTFDLPHQERMAKTAELKKKYNVKENALSFSSFIKEENESEEETISEEDIDEIVNNLTWEDIADLYEDDELVDDAESEEEDEDDEEEDEEHVKEEYLDEKLSAQARLKKRQAFARFRGKRNVARGMKLRRASSMNVLKKRAVLAARRAVYKRFLRGRDKSTLSAAEKDRIEQQVSRMKFIQAAIATKMLPKMRDIEQKRLASFRTKSSAPKMRPSKAPKLKPSKAPKKR